MTRNRWLLLIIALLIGWQLFGVPLGHWAHPDGQTSSTPVPAPDSIAQAEVVAPAVSAAPAAAPTSGLPPEAQTILQAIKRGGPFEFDRDGIVFGNFEGRLPKQPRGYYHEYTVPTPGLNHRGPRRIVSGGSPPTVFYYTDDHYESFRLIEGQP